MDHSLCVAALRSYKVDLESELATSPAQGLTETETANHKVVIQDLNRLIACYEGQSRREDSLFTSSDESASDSITDEVESTRNEVAGQAASSSATTASQRAESVHSDQASSGDEDGSYSGTSVKRRVYQARLFFPESDDHGSTIDAKIEQVSSEEGNSTSEDNARESKNDHTTRSGVQALTQFDMYKYGIDENDGVYALGRPPKRSNYFKDVFFRLDRIHVSLGFKTPQKSALMANAKSVMDRLKLRPEDCGVEARRLSGRLHDLPSHWKELPDTFRENYLSEMKRIVKLDPRVVYYGDWLLLDIIGRAAYRLYKRRFEKK